MLLHFTCAPYFSKRHLLADDGRLSTGTSALRRPTKPHCWSWPGQKRRTHPRLCSAPLRAPVPPTGSKRRTSHKFGTAPPAKRPETDELTVPMALRHSAPRVPKCPHLGM